MAQGSEGSTEIWVVYFAGPDDDSLLRAVDNSLLERGDVQKRDLPPNMAMVEE
jgi:hypothetical protein